MRSHTMRSLVLGAVIMSLFQVASRADTVVFDFTGHVTSVYDPFGLVGSLITAGDPVSASLQYDTATPDLFPADPTNGRYLGAGLNNVQIDDFFFAESFVQMDILHNGNGGQEYFEALGFDHMTAWPVQLPTFTHTELTFIFAQTEQQFNMLSSDALPTSIDFSKADFRLAYVRSATRDLNMYEIHFALAQVPELGTAALLATGLLVLAALLGAPPSAFSSAMRRMRARISSFSHCALSSQQNTN
jgi:hypothetical protein